MFVCPRCAAEIDETPPPERCPGCGRPSRGDSDDLAAAVAGLRRSAGDASPDHPGERRARGRRSPLASPPSSLAADLPAPLASGDDLVASGHTREFEVFDGECESGSLELPQPRALGESSRARRSSAGSPPMIRRLRRTGAPGPWALIGVVTLSLCLSLGAHWWASAGTERGRRAVASSAELRQIDLTLAADTPEAYQRARVLCDAAGLRLCIAEAALLQALRYGPDPVQTATARAILERLRDRDEEEDPYLRRVLALEALEAGDLDEASWHLERARGPRADLYRGLVAERRGDRRAAHAAALKVLSEEPGNISARILELESRGALELADLRRLAEAHPEHPGIQRRLIAALIAEGSLREAQQRADRLRAPPRAAPAFIAAGDLLRGEIAERRGEYTRALELYDRAAAHAGDRRDLALRRFHLLIAAGDHARLRNELAEALREREDDVEILALKVELDLRTGRAHEAAATQARLAELEEDGPLAPFLAGLLHVERGETDEALDAFAAAREVAPNFDRAVLEEARLLRLLGRSAEALALIQRQRVIVGETGDVGARRRLLAAELDVLLALGRRNVALALLDGALTADPGDNEARLRRAVLRLELGHRAAGRDDLLALRARCGEYPGLVGPLGRLYLGEGREDEAESLVAGITGDPRASDDALLLAAEIRLRRGDLTGAGELADRILLQRPSAWQGHLLRAKLLAARGDPAAALAVIEGVHAPTPSAEIELWTGRLLEANGRPGDALAHYRDAARLDPSLQEALLRHAALLLEGGLGEAAVAELAPLVDAGQGGAAARRLLARARWLAGDPDGALEVLDRVLDGEPDDAEAHYWRGVILDDHRRASRAIGDLEAALTAPAGTPWLADALRRLARAYTLGGDTARAEAIDARLATLGGR